MRYARRYDAWDPVQDLGMTAVGLLAAIGICFWHRADLLLLWP